MNDGGNQNRKSSATASASATQVVRNPVAFVLLVVLLVLLNLLVWIWWAPLGLFKNRVNDSQARLVFEAEVERLQRVIAAPCDSALIDAYALEKNQRSNNSLAPDPTVPPSAQPGASEPQSNAIKLPYGSLVSLLNNASVRVIAKGSVGSGFFINNQTVVTNRHVVENGLNSPIYVTSKTLGSNPVPVKVIGLSPPGDAGEPDFAILELPTPSPAVTPLKIGPDPNPLDEVVSVGFPGLLTEIDMDQITPNPIFGAGRVRTVKAVPGDVRLVFHTADISSGNSGGPLVNLCGHVVGVNTFVVAEDNYRYDGRALSSLAPSTLINFLVSHPTKYFSAQEGCVE